MTEREYDASVDLHDSYYAVVAELRQRHQFMRICTLNQDKLDQYFYDPPLHGSTTKRVRRAPLHMPEHRLRELLYNRLQPEQGEMQGFRQQLFECANGRWTA